jgi:hypothetical protein
LRVALLQINPVGWRLSRTEIIAQGFDEATVRRVLRLVRIAEFKRKQAPPVLCGRSRDIVMR